jgi:hypothetical protein
MEGSHLKGKNWYRRRFVYDRGAITADAAGHPRALGIKEVILAELLDFTGKRIFGPARLRLLQAELAKSASGDWQQHDDQPSTTRPTGPSSCPRRSPPSCSQKTKPRPMRTTRSGDSCIAGEGLIAKPATAIRAWAVWDLADRRWIRERIW